MSGHLPLHRTSHYSPWLPLIAAGALGLAGYFGPWTPHPAAGLVITGLDLAEYVKFLPQVMGGEIVLQREVFYTPLLAGSLIASLLSSRSSLALPLRLLLSLAAISLALAQLPPAWSPEVLRLPEFRLQVLSIAACLAAVPLAVLIRYLPDRAILIGASLLSLIAALWPAWSFLQVRPAIDAVYHAPAPLGLGFWAHCAGFVSLAVLSLAWALGWKRPGWPSWRGP